MLLGTYRCNTLSDFCCGMCGWECGTWDPTVLSSFDCLLRHQSTYNVISWYDPRARCNQFLMFLTTKWKCKWLKFSDGLPPPRPPNPLSVAPKKHIVALNKLESHWAWSLCTWHCITSKMSDVAIFLSKAQMMASLRQDKRSVFDKVLDLLVTMLCCGGLSTFPAYLVLRSGTGVISTDDIVSALVPWQTVKTVTLCTKSYVPVSQ